MHSGVLAGRWHAIADNEIPALRAVLPAKRLRDRPQLSIVRDLFGHPLIP